MYKTIFMGFLAVILTAGIVTTTTIAVQEVLAIGDVNENSARDFAPGIAKGFDPKPEPPGRDSSARDLAPGHSEIGDPSIVAPGHLKDLIKPGE
jgi:hypothetical protein